MSDSIIPSDELPEAELWLIPEMSSEHVVRFDRQGSAGGFRKHGPSPTTKTPRYLTEAQIDRHVHQAREEAEQEGFEQGRKAGYEQGYAEGQARGRELVEEYKAQMQQLLDKLACHIESQITADQRALEASMTDLIIKICERVCMQELNRGDWIKEIVSKAILGLPASEKSATLTVSESDFSLLENAPEFSQPYLHLKADKNMSAGSCRIISEHSEINFTLEDRFKQIVADYFDDSTRNQSASNVGTDNRSND